MGGLVQSLILGNLTAGPAGLAGLIVTGTLLTGGALLVRANFPRIWRLILQAINLVPAAILAVTGVFAIPLWWLMKRIVGALLRVFPADTAFARAMASCSQMFASREEIKRLLVNGERRKVCEALWPESAYPDLYRAV